MVRPVQKTQDKLGAIRLTPAEQEKIAHLAAVKQRKPHWIMKEALRQYMERETAKEQLRQQTLASWDDFVQTGLHVSEDEMNGWLDTWGSDHEVEPPKCRV